VYAERQVQQALAGYRACMRERGYPVRYPQDALKLAVSWRTADGHGAEGASTGELRLATVDAGCRTGSGLTAAIAATFERQAATWLARNEDLVRSAGNIIRAARERATEILAAAGPHACSPSVSTHAERDPTPRGTGHGPDRAPAADPCSSSWPAPERGHLRGDLDPEVATDLLLVRSEATAASSPNGPSPKPDPRRHRGDPHHPNTTSHLCARLRQLPQRQREVIVFQVFLDLDTEATAQALGMVRGTVTAHLSRAVATLRSCLVTE
jgi:hypothetical protein